VAGSGCGPIPLGILLVDDASDALSLRLRGAADIEAEASELAEQERDILDLLPADLRLQAKEQGGGAFLDALADSLSNFLRISDPEALEYAGDPQRAADRLFDRYVNAEVRPFRTHLPLYTLRAAATRFGESVDAEQEGWVRAPEHLRLSEDMFVAHVTGRSMEPLIPDGSLCVFRAGVTGSRQGRRLLIEQLGESDFANRYTVKRYTSVKASGDEGWEHARIRLEPLNPEFEAFDLGPEDFRVIAEFVEVLGPE